MIRTAELTVYYRHPQERVWSAITGGETNIRVTPISPEQATEFKPELGKAICQVTELDPMRRCAMRMRGPGFVTDWSAELSPDENGGTRVVYRQSTDYEARRLYIMAPIIMNPKTQLRDFSRELHKKLGKMC